MRDGKTDPRTAVVTRLPYNIFVAALAHNYYCLVTGHFDLQRSADCGRKDLPKIEVQNCLGMPRRAGRPSLACHLCVVLSPCACVSMAHRRSHHHSIRLNVDSVAHSRPWFPVMFTRPLYRVLLPLVAFLVVLWLFVYPLRDPHPIVPLHLPYQSHLENNLPHQYRPPRPYPPPPRPANVQWENRAQKVKDAFLHAWTGYQTHAAGWDELTPVDGGKVNK